MVRVAGSAQHLWCGQLFGCSTDARSGSRWERYQRMGLLLFARYDGPRYTLVALNIGDQEQSVPFWFPIGGNYVEELHGGDLSLSGITPLQETPITVPSHYGRIWTTVGP